MKKTGSFAEFHVNMIERVMVRPCLPSPKTILPLSAIDNMARAFSNVLLVYAANMDRVSADPAKVIREALSKVLVYYYPFAGRLRNKENGELEVECTGQGVLFLEAMADSDLSVLTDLDNYNPSFQQLIFSLPQDTDIEDLHLLIVQVTRFTCGGFVVGANVYGSACDAKGFGQFLQSMAEMARGEVKPSIEPIWNRELVKLEHCMPFRMSHLQIIHAPVIEEKFVQTSLVINFEIINHIRRRIMEERKESLSSFEIVAALVWLAKIKAFQIPHSENVKLLFAMDLRRSFNPPLPHGYYGNAFGIACAMDNVHDLLSGSLLRTIMIIKKSKFSLHKELNSKTVMSSSVVDVNTKFEDVVSISDWRHSIYYEVDFGWGDAMNVSTMLQQQEHEKSLPTYFSFLQSTKNMPDGIKMLMFMPPSKLKKFKIEIEAMIKKYVTKVCPSKL
uniref:Baccatin III:3-amino-3-phenylpropanoyltransferase n=2 Tax=Taxus cuspidata TaxID=99806 RepID=BAPT_TAXCU|nr:RecName: Full=Baccatin III:3-amino-3-phenylpropanoyltransferase [Taxus cuspidata]AAL92459.1 phenylpropanoyltransferase [Taxus cuspidata]